MAKQKNAEKGTLVLSVIAGLSVNGTFAALFSAVVPFSIFPLITLALSVYCLRQRHRRLALPAGQTYACAERRRENHPEGATRA